MKYDRILFDDVPLTQEFIAQMLGTRRATVTIAAGILQGWGDRIRSRQHENCKPATSRRGGL